MRYSRILRSTSEILNRRLEELKAVQEEELARARAAHRLDSLIKSVNFNMDSVLLAMMRTHPTDSIVAVADSDGFLSFRFVCVSDTVYDGPAMVLKDSLLAEPSDSLKADSSDSLTTTSVDSLVLEAPRFKEAPERPHRHMDISNALVPHIARDKK